METELSSQHQHAQWLASLATEHFVQQSLNSVAKDSRKEKLGAGEDDESDIVDMSKHAVVKLATDAADEETSLPEASATSSPFTLRRNLKKRKVDQNEQERPEFKLFRQKDRSGTKSFDIRRPVRPIDRQKMRPWLKNLLDTGSVFGLNWLEREEGIFQISWRHASRLGWNLETDGDVFERWARHTGIFKDGDEPEPKRWKANFRCALHSLPDVKELTSPTDRKGRNASRTYRFLQPNEVQPPVKRKQRYNVQIPFMYDAQASEDSGSQQADSDERNSEEEVVLLDKIQAFPLCDHDYALQYGKPTGEQVSAEAIRQNSGYVLIKSKDAHEIEFRLTQSEQLESSGRMRTSSSSKSSTQQKKGKVNKMKASPTAPVKKGRSKANQKAALKKGGKQNRRMKKSGDRSSAEPSTATKVSLKALLCGRKNVASVRKAKSSQMASLASKKIKRLNKPASPRAKKNKEHGLSSTMTSSIQPQGLDALLEAANQIEGMLKTRTSAPAASPSSMLSPSIPKRYPRPKAAISQPSPNFSPQPSQSPATRLSHKPTPTSPKTVSNSQLFVPGTNIVLTAHPVVATRATTFTSIPVVASMQAAGITSPVQSQVSLGMLQKILGLSTVETIPASSVPMTLVSGQVLTGPIITTKAEVKKSALKLMGEKPSQAIFVEQKPAGQKLVDQNDLNKKKDKLPGASLKSIGMGSLPGMPTLVTQPEGTSMLKHLLRLTGPSMNMSTTNITTTTTTVHRPTPALPQVSSSLKVTTASQASSTLAKITTPTLSQLFLAAGLTLKDSGAAAPSAVKTKTGKDCAGPTTGTGQNSIVFSVNQKEQNDGVYKEAGSPVKMSAMQPGDSSSGGVKQENSSNDLTKPLIMETEAPEDFQAVSNVSLRDTPDTCETDGILSDSGVQECASSQMVTPESAVLTQTTAPQNTSANSVQQVTLCLSPAVLGSQTHQVSREVAQTMTVTLPQGMVPSLPGQTQGSSMATFTHSMDLLQFLNLCAASGSNGQVIIKTEPSPLPDVSAASNVVLEQAAMNCQSRAETSAVLEYSMLEPCEKVNLTDTAVTKGIVPDMSEDQVLLTNSASVVASVGSPALKMATVSPALLPSIDSATMDTSALSSAMQSLNTIDSPTLSTTMLDPLAAAMQSSAICTSGDCPNGLSPADTQADLVAALTAVSGAEEPISVPAAHQVTQADLSLSGAHDAMTSEFVDEANLVAALSADQQGADSFIVEDMLL